MRRKKGMQSWRKARRNISAGFGIRRISGFRERTARLCSRESVSTCFIFCSPREGTEGPEWVRKGCQERDMKGTISGIRRCMCCRCLCIPSRRLPGGFWTTGTALWNRPGKGPGFWGMTKALCSPGAPSTGRRRPPIIRWEPPNTISTRILPMHCPCTCR